MEHRALQDTEEHVHWDSGVPSHWAWRVQARQANGAQCEEAESSRGHTFLYRWPRQLLHLTHAETCLSWSLAPRRKLHYSSQHGRSGMRGWVSLQNHCWVSAGYVGVDENSGKKKRWPWIHASRDWGRMRLQPQHPNALTRKDSVCVELQARKTAVVQKQAVLCTSPEHLSYWYSASVDWPTSNVFFKCALCMCIFVYHCFYFVYYCNCVT